MNFEVLNVGQGDCIIIRPTKDCLFKNEVFIVDLGPESCDISKYIGENDKVHLIFTHSHGDHVGGFKNLNDKLSQVEDISMPAFQNEIVMIIHSILRLKGISKAKDCDDLIEELRNTGSDYVDLISKAGLNDIKINFLRDGGHPKKTVPKNKCRLAKLCNHIEYLNPQMNLMGFRIYSSDEIEQIQNVVEELFDSNYAAQIRPYIVNIEKPQSFFDDDDSMVDELLRVGHGYVLSFIDEYSDLMRAFNQESTRENLKKIVDQVITCIHDACVVIKATYNGKTMLLTGDATPKVFENLGKIGHIDYLKMPHHGSSKNITKEILEKIKPEYAIISHNNRKFGTGESHPHHETIELLRSCGIKILYTNDVIKEGEAFKDSYPIKAVPYEDNWLKVHTDKDCWLSRD